LFNLASTIKPLFSYLASNSIVVEEKLLNNGCLLVVNNNIIIKTVWGNDIVIFNLCSISLLLSIRMKIYVYNIKSVALA